MTDEAKEAARQVATELTPIVRAVGLEVDELKARLEEAKGIASNLSMIGKDVQALKQEVQALRESLPKLADELENVLNSTAAPMAETATAWRRTLEDHRKWLDGDLLRRTLVWMASSLAPLPILLLIFWMLFDVAAQEDARGLWIRIRGRWW